MQRFFVTPETLAHTAGVLHEEELVHQLSRVLRVKTSNHVVLLPGDGTEVEVELTEIGKKEISFRMIETRANTAEPEMKITLFQAVPKKLARFESALQHGTEVGISRFVPLTTARTEGQLRNTDRCTKIIREAAEQSERGIVPKLGETTTLDALVQNMPAGVTIVADSYRREPLLAALLPELASEQQINIVIGPEGGLTADEVAQLEAAGAKAFSLGPRILRTETAGLAVASALFFG